MELSNLNHLKKELSLACRIIAYMGWDDINFGHCSLRISPDFFLINQSGVDFDSMTSENIVLINSNGEPQESFRPASFKLHKIFHTPEAAHNVVLHSHYGPAVALANVGRLLYRSQYEGMLGKTIFINDLFTGFEPGDTPTAQELSGVKSIFCARHGVFACGRTVPEAMFQLFISCRAGELVTAGPLKPRPPFTIEWPPQDQVQSFWDSLRIRIEKRDNNEVRKAS